MVIAYLIFGMLAGSVSFVAALVLGASVWSAIGLYSLVGAISVLTLALGRFALGSVRERGVPMEPADRNVTVSEPLNGTSALAPALAPVLAPSGERAMKILAVDDDAFILELIPMIAAKVGCRNITTVTSGAEALLVLQQSAVPFDCLLLDINMPGMDGIELCARIRSLAAYRDTPIIMLTAMSDIDHLDRAFRAGASDYTAKPFDIIEFGDRLKTAQARTNALGQAVPADAALAADEPGRESVGAWGEVRLAPLATVSALIEYGALQNYLSRLKGTALGTAYVMAIAVERHDALSGEPPAQARLLVQVAAAIDAVCGTSRYLMAYAGHGQFILVGDAARLPNPVAIETAIQTRLDKRTDAVPGTAHQTVLIAVGMAVRPATGKARRARIACQSAIQLAKDRAAGRHGAVKPAATRRSVR